MIRTRLSLLTRAAVILAGPIALPAPASAEPTFTQRGAENTMKRAVNRQYPDYPRSAVFSECRPQGRQAPSRRSSKHSRWVCIWSVPGRTRCTDGGTIIVGRFLLIGRQGKGNFTYRILNPANCER